MGFTENQRRAVEERGNIIVSAGAGSGKTTVMIARIIDKLKNGELMPDGRRQRVGLEQMLIVTFTRSAAADMRIKLTEKLYKLKEDKSDKAAVLAAIEALDALPSCNIGTLHSYCQKLVKAYFYAAELDPSAVVCDSGEADMLKLDAVAEAVAHAYKSGDALFKALYEMLGSRRNDDGVKETVAEILEFALSMPDPIGYLTSGAPDSDSFATLDNIVGERKAALVSRIEALKKDLAAADMKEHVTVIDEFGDFIAGTIDDITGTTHTKAYDQTDVLNEQFLALKSDCRKFRTFYKECEDAKTVDGAPYAQVLRSVALDAFYRYAERKRSLGKMDYSDLEHGAIRVLSDETALKEIARTVKYVFIDEFQDVNPLQSAIAERFRASGAEMFVVGDVKQSIYGFRRCSPEHFIRAVNSRHYTHITLADNFRSDAAVIDFINSAFCGVMTEAFGGVDYANGGQKLVYGNTALSGGSASLYLAAPVTEEARQPGNDTLAPAEREKAVSGGYSVVNESKRVGQGDGEARLIADCIIDYLATANEPRLGDIAVLMRSVNTPFAAALMRELDASHIKYRLCKKSKASSFPEVVALVDILRCVDNRFDDVALYTALRSALGGFSDAELYEIAEQGDKRARENGVYPMGSGERKPYLLWQKLTAYDGRLREKASAFIEKRDDIARFAQTHDCADTMGYATARLDYFQHVYESGGCAEAVDALLGFAADRATDLHTFLNYYDASDFELEIKGGGDAVTISTVHASKGLEYGLVIVADTSARFNESDRYGRVTVSERGVFVRVPDAESRTLKKTAPWLVESLLYPDRERGEQLRLLYVALTRAKNRLIVTGKDKKLKPTAPRDCLCPLGFLQNVRTSLPDFAARPCGDDAEVEYPESAEVVEAVAKRHERAAEYNALREKNNIPIKTCVTAVSHRAAEEEDYTSRAPVLTRDDSDESVDARSRGTAYHRAMELVDFEAPNMDELRRACENFDLTDEGEILRAAEKMRELCRGSTHVVKERSFIVNLPAEAVYGTDASDENILVQGVIDLFVVDADGNAVIVDYKTGDPRSLDNEGYRTQLRLYAMAVEAATPYKVVRAALYSFASGELIDLL